MKKNLIILVFVISMFASISWAKSFIDVPNDHWAYKYINELSNEKVIDGYEDNSYKPSSTITNGEFVKLVVASSASKDLDFSSANGSLETWAKDYIKIAENYEVLKPSQITDANVNNPIKRIEMAQLIANADRKFLKNDVTKNENLSFTDIEDLTEDEIVSLKYCFFNGLIMGYEDNSFKPDDYMNRAETATIIYRFLEKNKEAVKISRNAPLEDKSVEENKGSSVNKTEDDKEPEKKSNSSSSSSSGVIKKYTITFKDEDGKVLQSSKVNKGKTPEYTGEIPIKANSTLYNYSFNGWEPEITKATENKTYTATYTQSKIERAIRVSGDIENGNVEVSLDDNNKAVITVTPDDGFGVDTITVKDSEGNELPYTKNEDGTYTTNDTIPSDIVIEVSFTQNITTIVFNKNLENVSGEMANQTIKSNTSENLNNNAFARKGYAFLGWALTADGEKVYDDKATFSAGSETSQIELFALWQAVPASVTINPNGGTYKGSADIINVSGEYAGQLEVEDAVFEQHTITFNYNEGSGDVRELPFNCFDGWDLEGKGTFENGTYTFDEGDGTLIAKCKDEVILPGAVRKYFKFEGWFLGSGDSTKIGDSGDTYKPQELEDEDLFAHWTFDPKLTVTITGEGSGEAHFDEEFNIVINVSPKEHYYASLNIYDDNGYGYDYNSVDGYDWDEGHYITYDEFTTDMYIDIVFEEETFYLGVDAGNGKWNGNSGTSYCYGAYGEQLEIPDAVGLRRTVTFDGNGGTPEVESATFHEFDSWTHTGAGSFEDGVFTFGDDSSKLTANYVSEVVLPNATRDDYRIIGWYAGTGNNATKIGDVGDTYSITKLYDHTIYAKWGFEPERVESKANAPTLGEGMKAVYWDEDNEEYIEDEFEDGMFSYVMGDGWTDTKDSKWANAKTEDGSYWVWIPRFAYRISYTKDASYTTKSDSKTLYGVIDVIFLNGTSNDTYLDMNGEEQELPDDYVVHPAFQAMTNEDVENLNYLGKWNEELEGIWFAKFEAACEIYDETNEKWKNNIGSDNLISDTRRLVSKPSLTSWTNICVDKMYRNGLSVHPELNSHMMKSSEWGAALYLAFSPYGRNTNEIGVNQCKSYRTGGGPGKNGTSLVANDTYNFDEDSFYTDYAWNTEQGMLASTTGNIYGIYDMAGSYYEHAATFIQANDSHLTNSNEGGTLGTLPDVPTSDDLKTRQIYPNPTNSRSPIELYNANSFIYGDGVCEVSVYKNKMNTWLGGDETHYPGDSYLFMEHGCNYACKEHNMFRWLSMLGEKEFGSSYRVTLAIPNI